MKSTGKRFVLIAGVVLAAILITGCETQNSPDTKKSRLIAAENLQLRKDLQQRDRELELRNREIEKQKELVNNCLEQKKALDERLQGNIKTEVSEVLAPVMEENTKLRDENEKLKAQIEELKKK